MQEYACPNFDLPKYNPPAVEGSSQEAHHLDQSRSQGYSSPPTCLWNLGGHRRDSGPGISTKRTERPGGRPGRLLYCVHAPTSPCHAASNEGYGLAPHVCSWKRRPVCAGALLWSSLNFSRTLVGDFPSASRPAAHGRSWDALFECPELTVQHKLRSNHAHAALGQEASSRVGPFVSLS